jgi:ATP-binding cassette subfamily B protein
MSGAGHKGGSLYRRLYRHTKPYARLTACIFLLDLLATPLLLLSPLPLKIAVDSVIGAAPLPGPLARLLPDFAAHSSFWLLVVAVALQVLLVLLGQLQELGAYVLRTYAGEGMTLGLRAKLFQHAQRLSLSFHDQRGTADSIYRIQYDAPAVQYITIYGAVPLATSLLMLCATLYVIARIDRGLALVAVAVSPALALLSRSYRERMLPRYKSVKGMESEALHIVQEVLTSLRVVKAFGREESEHGRFLHSSKEGVRARIGLAFSEGTFGLLINLVTAVGTAAVLLIGVYKVQAGRITLGEMLMVIAYLAQLYAPLKTISKTVGTLQSSAASVERVFELLDEEPEVAERPDARPVKRAAGAVEFRDVSFAYNGRSPVIRGVSFSIPAGARVGIAGRTGAGKTTLVSLLTRLYDPNEGRILLDGTDLRDYKLSDLRNQFAIVLQEPVLFSTSILENIAYARPEATQQEIVSAARAAGAHDFITRLPEGYKTRVGERGMRLSGGERQRVSLARAFLKDAPVLILDEPTSSVDVKTEAEIMETMRRLMEGRTTLMIAHRLSTLEHCDLRLEIEAGRLVSLTQTAPEKEGARALAASLA